MESMQKEKRKKKRQFKKYLESVGAGTATTGAVCSHCTNYILEKEEGIKCPKCRYDICAVCRAKEDMEKLVCLEGHLIKFYPKDELKHRWDG